MPTIFHPHPTLSSSTPPRDITYLLGQLKTDDRIVFTKSGLVGFLKMHGVEVETNLNELKGTVKFAEFGRLEEVDAVGASNSTLTSTLASGEKEAQQNVGSAPAVSQVSSQSASRSSSGAVAAGAQVQAQSNQDGRGGGYTGDTHRQHNPAVRDAAGDAFRPTRRVRELIGGGSSQIQALFGSDDDRTDAAPSQGPLRSTNSPSNPVDSYSNPSDFQPNKTVVDPEGHAFRPTRRVREPIGGGSQAIASLFSDEENIAPRRR